MWWINNFNQTKVYLRGLSTEIEFFFKFKSCLGSPIPADLDSAFNLITNKLKSDLFEPQRQRLLPNSNKNKDWLARLESAITSDCRRQSGACVYHLQNIIAYENQVIELAEEYNPLKGRASGQVMALTAEKIDFEFHALTFALKAYICFLSNAVFSFFKRERYSFNEYEKLLPQLQPSHTAHALKILLDQHWPRFSKFYSIEERKAVRDLVAHYRYIVAGTIDIHSGQELSVGIVMPKEIIQNELVEPEYSPLKHSDIGLGMGKLMSEHLSYIFTLSMEMFKTLGLYE